MNHPVFFRSRSHGCAVSWLLGVSEAAKVAWKGRLHPKLWPSTHKEVVDFHSTMGGGWGPQSSGLAFRNIKKKWLNSTGFMVDITNHNLIIQPIPSYRLVYSEWMFFFFFFMGVYKPITGGHHPEWGTCSVQAMFSAMISAVPWNE